MKLFVKLRESGEVMEIQEIMRYEGKTRILVMMVNPHKHLKEHIIGTDCDLCDEKGRLLVPDSESSQNQRMREWFSERTGLGTDELLSVHMKAMDRLLKPEDPTQALKDELLEAYRAYLRGDFIIGTIENITDLEAKLKLNTNEEGNS